MENSKIEMLVPVDRNGNTFDCINWTDRAAALAIVKAELAKGESFDMALRRAECEVTQIMAAGRKLTDREIAELTAGR